ncbi:nucleotide exchange factor GrpE [Candidatus Falkowbacteria bacterium]|nr:nucleotide exchange factor GrpE [Candidatus Falkowbacteria bacterium]NCT54392.1 nucleotide exchange factor GrpE [Candidatus Falkowbacteria bacterium]
MSELKKGIYRHYKGGEYELLEEALDEKNKEEKVIYRSLKDEKIWVRAKNNFLEKVEVEKEKKPRFEFLREVEVASSEQKYLRALADYQNLLKQSAKERTEFVKFALEDFLHDLLPVYDHLKLSLKGLSEEEGKSAWVEGVRHVLKQFKKTLENRGIEEIKTEGEKFNHDEMEAIAGEGEKVKSEVMPGYKLNGKVIRVAKVIVE